VNRPDVKVKHIILDDEVIAIALVSVDARGPHLAIRWRAPRPYKDKSGNIVETTNHMGGETDLFVLPFTLAAAIGRTLIELKTARFPYIKDDGFEAMVAWLTDVQEVHDAMCY
jgi:hypothetical protein